MQWTYTILAEAKPRVLMRIAQLFEQQMVSMQSCHLLTENDRLHISIVIYAEAEMAQRIHAKLWKQIDLLGVDLLPQESERRREAAVDCGPATIYDGQGSSDK